MNRLAEAASPYLRQHRDNPVDWYPWSEEAFAAARERGVPILLSIGYSACHWCHVMARESFSDEQVAELINENFVAIKVDREERPDVDSLYMSALQSMSGRGGWPLTMALDHDGRPFWGGTYFPTDAFVKVLNALTDAWRNQPEQISSSADKLVADIGTSAQPTPASDIPDIETINTALNQLAAAHDADWGGFGKEPKFPTASQVTLLLRAYMATGADTARSVLTTTLDAMAAGGIYDQIGGGFFRYSTDREWLVPHFEKMLSDQALLVRLYREAFSILGNQRYRAVVTETIDFVLRELRDEQGGFYTALDAESIAPNGDSVEGLFYTWVPEELRRILDGARIGDEPVDVDAVLAWFDIGDDGHHLERSVPNRRHQRDDQLRPPEIEAVRRALLEVRDRRPRPERDNKVLLEWNALFLYALADAAACFQNDEWKQAAVDNAEFLLNNMRGEDGRWLRSWQPDAEPPAQHDALAADHAALLEAFLRVAELTGQARWIEAAIDVADWLLDDFFDPVDGGLWTSAEYSEHLVVRAKDIVDNATPSANATAAIALQRLAALTGEQRYLHLADRMLQLIAGALGERPLAHAHGLIAAELRHRGVVELAIVGDTADADSSTAKMVRLAQMIWRPNLVLAWGEEFDSPLFEGRENGKAYLCRNAICDAPVNTPEELYERLVGKPLEDGQHLRV